MARRLWAGIMWRLAFPITLSGALLAGAATAWGCGPAVSARTDEVGTAREYVLEIIPKDIEYGGGAVWHAWTFHGTVPGPTLIVTAGELLRVTIINRHDMVHSFHTHLDGYSFENDGSQTNIITGKGAGGILSPGSKHTWEFKPTTPGIYYYHDHYADKGFKPSQIVGQGLYGAIIVLDPEEPPMREEVLFMGEIGFDNEGNVAPFIMNGMGFPGGEVALEEMFHEHGYGRLAEEFNRTLPYITAKVSEPFKLHVINIGNLEHSLYIHSATVTSLGVLDGRPWPGRVLPLVPGSADTLLVEFDNAGLWLFHCHVETHADLGMIGLFDIAKE